MMMYDIFLGDDSLSAVTLRFGKCDIATPQCTDSCFDSEITCR